jgi:protein arginine N-methyltransferase 1
LAGDTRAWAPVYVPLPAPVAVTTGDHVAVALTRTTSDDGIHPDYRLSIGGRPFWRSPHHGGPFRATPFYRRLFPAD